VRSLIVCADVENNSPPTDLCRNSKFAQRWLESNWGRLKPAIQLDPLFSSTHTKITRITNIGCTLCIRITGGSKCWRARGSKADSIGNDWRSACDGSRSRSRKDRHSAPPKFQRHEVAKKTTWCHKNNRLIAHSSTVISVFVAPTYPYIIPSLSNTVSTSK
jgi:hypothetical protein